MDPLFIYALTIAAKLPLGFPPLSKVLGVNLATFASVYWFVVVVPDAVFCNAITATNVFNPSGMYKITLFPKLSGIIVGMKVTLDTTEVTLESIFG